MNKEKAVNTIGVLTSGGDAPGMNAAIRAIVRTAVANDIKCLGINRGYNGLINGDIVELDSRSVDGILNRGGTMLYTARCEEFRTEEGLKKAADMCRYRGIEGLVVIGGDGTFRGALELAKHGVPVIGVPGTIDNDIACSQYSIGFDTACNTALDATDKLRDTMQSHERCSVVEVMGRNAGHLALYVGIASGATAILVPERTVDFGKDIIDKIRKSRIQGKNHFIVIVAEGFGKAEMVADKIYKMTGIEARVTVLGHVQRGGSPSARDRVTASRMGFYAVKLLQAGKSGRAVGLVDSEIVDFDIGEALLMKKDLHEESYDVSRLISN